MKSTTVLLFIAVGILVGLLIYLIFFNKQKEKYESKKEYVQPSSSAQTATQQGKDGHIVFFKMTGCGPCANFTPSWNAAKEKCSSLAPGIKFVEFVAGEVDPIPYNIPGFPTVRFYPGEVSPEAHYIQYQGDRSTSSVEKFALSQGKVNE